MKKVSAVFVFALLVMCISDYCVAESSADFPLYPDTAFQAKQSKSKMNFGKKPDQARDMDEQYPAAKNSMSYETPKEVNYKKEKKGKTICIGIDCGCGVGKSR